MKTLLPMMLCCFLAIGPAAADGMIDPMKPPAFALQKYRQEKALTHVPRQSGKPEAASNKPRWKLSSILYAPSRRQAIVNGKLVRVGQKIDGARVIRIERDRVRLSAGGRIQILKLGLSRPSIKTFRNGKPSS